jgi:methylamine---glutamate N-methyltransferase subunit A
MCGIVGLYLKTDRLKPELGAHLSTMLGVMCDRGPDSAGFAVYGGGAPDRVKLTVRGTGETDFAALADNLAAALSIGVDLTRHDTHAVLDLPAARAGEARAWLADALPSLALVGEGQSMTLFKEVGRPDLVATRFGLDRMAGTHGIGHTRMATESAVTTDGAHPFSTGRDQCLVHNGSLSNHNAVRRTLRRNGIVIDTENDSEVAAGYLTWKMREGLSLGQALEASLADLDGFYTFVVGTRTGFGVLRDPIACKPAVMAETDDYVAFGSEYRALVDLPGIEAARVFEPEPATVYFWERS